MQQGVSKLVAKGRFSSLAFQNEISKLPLIFKDLTACRELLLLHILLRGAVDVDAELAGLGAGGDKVQLVVPIIIPIHCHFPQPLTQG